MVKKIRIKSPVEAKKYKIALLTEERRSTGVFGVLSVLDNTLIANLARYIRFYLLNERQCKEEAAKKYQFTSCEDSVPKDINERFIRRKPAKVLLPDGC